MDVARLLLVDVARSAANFPATWLNSFDPRRSAPSPAATGWISAPPSPITAEALCNPFCSASPPAPIITPPDPPAAEPDAFRLFHHPSTVAPPGLRYATIPPSPIQTPAATLTPSFLPSLHAAPTLSLFRAAIKGNARAPLESPFPSLPSRLAPLFRARALPLKFLRNSPLRSTPPSPIHQPLAPPCCAGACLLSARSTAAAGVPPDFAATQVCSFPIPKLHL
uniref:Uncharacterized protein n=1 Tax=Setaria viridis TaxID=4556 RepID=A0A4U6W8T9_SETVI|nr:hypothetical protein SEVIR_1G157700v2 [Setaria viridis]